MNTFQNSQSNHQDTTFPMQESESKQVAVIMVPFLAHSHLNQLLQLSHLITSSYQTIAVHYVSSSIHIKQAKTRAHGVNLSKIHFRELPMAEFESPPPNPNSPNKYPMQLLPLWEASMTMREPFADYLRGMCSKYRKVVVIHDVGISCVVQDVVSIDNAESYVFNPVSAISLASFFYEWQGRQLPLEGSEKMPSLEDCVPDEALESTAIMIEPKKHRSGDLYNTVRSIEAPFLDLLAKEDISEGKKIWAIGPMLPIKLPSSGQEYEERSKDKCLKWLDERGQGSVIYVSFGTTTSVSDEQNREIAIGLEESDVSFLWILRDADKGDVFDGKVRTIELPLGFEDRNEGVGLVVRDWAPQLHILAHPSTGGFMSHCGWNSCLESLTLGVPLAAWPMHADQPRNAYLVTEILKAGIAVRDWTQRREVMRASEIADVVRRLMGSEEGAGIRKRAQEIGSNLRRATEEGGESKVELDSFIAHIARE